MNDPETVGMSNESRRARNSQAPHPRAVGSPLPRGSALQAARSSETGNPLAPPPPGRALTSSAPPSDADSHSSSVQRAVNLLRNLGPFVQRILPLLDGNFATAVSNVLTPQPKAAPPVDLAPFHEGMATVQLQQRELRDQVAEQHAALKKVEDQLDLVREATDRNTLEQQELMEDLKSVGNKVNLVALIALALLLVSVFLNLFLYMHIEHVLP